MTTGTFREAYGVLQRHAETLRNQREPNIDDLLTIVTESVDAYKVCSARIDAVERALEQALVSAGVEGAGLGGPSPDAGGTQAGAVAPRIAPRPPASPTNDAGGPDVEAGADDIPF